MKTLIIAAIISSSALAQSITGVAVLKGSLKTKVPYNGVEATCKVKVEQIRNIRDEDAYGFPGYRVVVSVDLNGRTKDGDSVVNFDRQYTLTNFWNVNGMTVAKDLDYFSTDGANLTIKPDGRLRTFAFPVDGRTITCAF